jgi:hypothetical protein
MSEIPSEWTQFGGEIFGLTAEAEAKRQARAYFKRSYLRGRQSDFVRVGQTEYGSFALFIPPRITNAEKQAIATAMSARGFTRSETDDMRAAGNHIEEA